MANIVRYDPFDVMEGMVKSMLRPLAFDELMNRMTGRSNNIPIDIEERDRAYTLWADLPGVSKDDISVSITGNQVSLSAEPKREKAVDEEKGQDDLEEG